MTAIPVEGTEALALAGGLVAGRPADQSATATGALRKAFTCLESEEVE